MPLDDRHWPEREERGAAPPAILLFNLAVMFMICSTANAINCFHPARLLQASPSK